MNLNEYLDRYIQKLNEATEKGGYGVTKENGKYCVSWADSQGYHEETFDDEKKAKDFYCQFITPILRTDSDRPTNGKFYYWANWGETESNNVYDFKESNVYHYANIMVGATPKKNPNSVIVSDATAYKNSEAQKALGKCFSNLDVSCWKNEYNESLTEGSDRYRDLERSARRTVKQELKKENPNMEKVNKYAADINKYDSIPDEERSNGDLSNRDEAKLRHLVYGSQKYMGDEHGGFGGIVKRDDTKEGEIKNLHKNWHRGDLNSENTYKSFGGYRKTTYPFAPQRPTTSQVRDQVDKALKARNLVMPEKFYKYENISEFVDFHDGYVDIYAKTPSDWYEPNKSKTISMSEKDFWGNPEKVSKYESLIEGSDEYRDRERRAKRNAKRAYNSGDINSANQWAERANDFHEMDPEDRKWGMTNDEAQRYKAIRNRGSVGGNIHNDGTKGVTQPHSNWHRGEHNSENTEVNDYGYYFDKETKEEIPMNKHL